jgi:adenylate cyclase
MRRLRRRQRRLRHILLALVGLVSAAVAVTAYATGVADRLERSTVDTRFDVHGRQRAPSDIVTVDIDDHTFNALRRQWPFPRSLHGRVITRIAAGRPRAIVYDVQFTEPTQPAEDNALIRAIARARGKVVLATTEVDEAGRSNVLGGDALLREIHARAGNSLLPADTGGVIRRLPLEVQRLPSLALAAAEIAAGRRFGRAQLGSLHPWIDFLGPAGTIRHVSFADVAQGAVSPGFFRDKVVVVGATAPSLQDVHTTSASRDEFMSGAEIQANAISTVLRGAPLRSAAGVIDVVLIVLIALLAPLAALRWRPGWTLAIAIVVGALYALAVQLAFDSGWVLALVYPLVGLALATVGTLAVHYLLATVERERVRDVFARFVPDRVVDDVLARTDDDLRLGGVRRTSTVLFSDLRGFTSFAEKLSPDQVIEVLNRYLGEMTAAILERDGTLVSYMGDGIMAVFGAPLEQPDHADRALASARDMVGERLESFNRWLRAAGLGDGFRMGIGLNSGEVMSGNVGSEQRMEYTAIGDTTNTASRLEGMTKDSAHMVFVAEATRSMLTAGGEDLVSVGELAVRGRAEALRVWALPDSRRREA